MIKQYIWLNEIDQFLEKQRFEIDSVILNNYIDY